MHLNPYQVFHSTSDELRKKLHFVLVRPEQGGNVGAAARALENMGMAGSYRIVGSPEIINDECRKFAVHAGETLEKALFFDSLKEALKSPVPSLSIAATARVGSAHRPHPLLVRDGIKRAVEKLQLEELEAIYLVFGPESDGLTNEDVDLCDWVVTIPSLGQYRSLNLAQAILIFSYELNVCLLRKREPFESDKPSQRNRLIRHMIRLAEEVGFILPGDPFKMRPRLECILSVLPHHIQDVKTLHGLFDQAIRSVRKGQVDWKGRYRHYVEVKDGNAKRGPEQGS